MRHLAILIAALTAMACSAARDGEGEGAMIQLDESVGANSHEASMTATLEFLLASSAADFHANPPAEALRFYNVRIGYLTTSDGSVRYMLCGDFASEPGSGHGERTSFATIDSPGGPNGYQQSLGGSICDDPSANFGNADDLSSSLQSRFDALSL